VTAFLILVGAGLAGAFLRALTSTTQTTWSRQTLADTLVGGLASPLVLTLASSWGWGGALIALPLYEKAVLVGFVGYSASHLFVTLIRKRLRATIAPKDAPAP